jgi:hypothetical protein
MHAPSVPQGDATGGIIPYKNPLALIAYYLGIFGLIPCFGPVLALPAVVLGILGLRKHKQNPLIRGVVHAWLGIVLGFLSLVGHAAIFLFLASRR